MISEELLISQKNYKRNIDLFFTLFNISNAGFQWVVNSELLDKYEQCYNRRDFFMAGKWSDLTMLTETLTTAIFVGSGLTCAFDEHKNSYFIMVQFFGCLMVVEMMYYWVATVISQSRVCVISPSSSHMTETLNVQTIFTEWRTGCLKLILL